MQSEQSILEPVIASIGSEICFRFLNEDEYYKLVDIYNERESEIPNPKLSRVYVAELVDEIIGIAVFDLRPHIAMWIDPKFRGSKIWIKLASGIESSGLSSKADNYIIATTTEVVKMCEALELEKLECPVYVKRKL